MSIGLLLQAVTVGLSIGGIYALIGMGFSLCWALTRTYALAHGDLVVAAVLIAVAATVGETPAATGPGPLPSVLIVALSLVVGAGIGGASYVGIVRPALRNRSGDALTWAAGLLVLGLALRALLAVLFGGSGVSAADPLHLGLGLPAVISLPGGGAIPVRSIGVIAVAALAAIGFDRLLITSRWGRSVTAAADNPGLASLCGLDPERITLVAFAVAGTIAGLAGLLVAPGQTVSPNEGVLLGVAGAAAALTGRASSPRAAVPAGLAIGVAQQLILLAGGAAVTVSDVLPGGVLIAVALIKPQGLATLVRRRPRPAQ